MRRFQRLAGCLVAIDGLGTLLISPPVAAMARVAVDGAWSPGSPAIVGELSGVSALSPSSAWAVGIDGVILRWNGKTWSEVKSPTPHIAVLEAVSARSKDDAWAVGFYTRSLSSQSNHSFIVHWNGKAWSITKSPVMGAIGTQLTGVAAVSATDAWAVGTYCPNYCYNSEQKSQALILRWDGARWIKVKAPSPCAGMNFLHSVTASSATAAWAAGECDGQNGSIRPLLLRWNGKSWSAARVPDPGISYNWLNSVTAVSRTNAWAVGVHYLNNGYTPVTLTLRWNGRRWSRVASPDPGRYQNVLTGVSAVSASNAWAVGYGGDPASSGWVILAFHWNGRYWTSSIPATVASQPADISISADSTHDAWLVGPYPSSCRLPLMLHWDGSNWIQSC